MPLNMTDFCAVVWGFELDPPAPVPVPVLGASDRVLAAVGLGVLSESIAVCLAGSL
jgi:hypothetical protein